MPITSKSFDQCPVCEGPRFKGRTLPICQRCEETLADMDFVNLYHRLRQDNAPQAVMQPLIQAFIADCKDVRTDAAHARPVRKPRATKANAKPTHSTAK